jgi:hypothetical protein
MDDSRKVIKVVIRQKSIDFVRSFSETEWKWKESGSYDISSHQNDESMKDIFFIINDGLMYFKNYNDVIKYARKNNTSLKIIEEKSK